MENIFVLFLLVVVSMIDRASISIAMPTIAKDLGLSDTMQGLILSGFSGLMHACKYRVDF